MNRHGGLDNTFIFTITTGLPFFLRLIYENRCKYFLFLLFFVFIFCIKSFSPAIVSIDNSIRVEMLPRVPVFLVSLYFV